MTESAHLLSHAPVFNGMKMPYSGHVAGYAAIVNALDLKMPLPRPLTMFLDNNILTSIMLLLLLPSFDLSHY